MAIIFGKIQANLIENKGILRDALSQAGVNMMKNQNQNKNKFLFLGTGGSAGIPMVACHCSVCTSSDPKNKRLRPSALLTINGKKLLIDTGPDFRAQALAHQISHLDGVLLTHTHFDHIAGLDELRSFYLIDECVLPVLVSSISLEEIKQRFAYFFKERSWGKSLSAQLHFTVLPAMRGKVNFCGIEIQYMSYEQGGMQVTGYRFGDLAYISDIYRYEETIFEDLQGVKTLIISALRHAKSPVHFTVADAVAFAKKVGALQTYLMHISHELDHESASRELSEGIFLAYDGLTLEF